MKNPRRATRVVGYAIIFAGPAILLILLDILIGSVNGVGDIRLASRQFRSEAASMGLNVKALVPGTSHQYADPNNPNSTRLFRVDDKGQILNGSGPRAEPDIKLLFLGGSTTENNEVNESKRFPAAVEALLQQQGLNVQAFNYGVRGHTSQESILSLLSKPGIRDSKYIFLMHNINDRLWLSRYEDYTPRPSLIAPTTWSSVKDASSQLLLNIWEYITYRSNIVFLIRQRFEFFNPWSGEASHPGVVSERNITDNKLDPQDYEAFATNLRIFISIARTLGAEPVLLTQPLVSQSPGQVSVNEIIRKTASSSKVLLVDLAKEMAEDGKVSLFFLADGIHFNDAGSMYAAEIIYNRLKQKIQSDPAANVAGVLKPTRLIFSEQDCNAPSPRKPGQFAQARRVLEISGRYPVFSKDASWLLFQSWSSGRESIFGLRKKDSRIVRLSPLDELAVNERHPAIIASSDEYLRFVFGSGYSHGSPELERLMIREWPEMTSQALIPDELLGGSIPAAHGGTIYFAGYTAEGPLSTPNILSVDLKTRQINYKTRDGNEDWRPALSPQGDLAFISKRGGNFELHEITESGETRRLVEHDADIWDPSYSHDGKYIAFAAKEGNHWVIKMLNRKSGEVVKLTDGRQDDWDPVFHPNGKALYFGRSYGQEPYIYALCLD